MVEVGREENEIYQRISRPVFSPDSEHLAYVASDSGKDSAAFVIVDNVKGETYDEIYSLPTFSQDNNYIGYGARKGDELWWIVDKVGAPKPTSTPKIK
jgi:hypothetical protein